ncbi:MAG: VWA domain-containing protein [Bacteroidota bacterium]
MNHRGFLQTLGILILLASFQTLLARPNKIDRKHQALNRYIEFSNECIHTLSTVQERLEDFNIQLLENKNDAVPGAFYFNIDDLVENFRFFNILKGTCTNVLHKHKPHVQLRVLYERTTIGGSYIPTVERSKLNHLRNTQMFQMIEFLSLCDTLAEYTRRNRFMQDPDLKTAYWVLNRCEDLYNEFSQTTEQLSVKINGLANPTPQEILDLTTLIKDSRKLIESTKADSPSQTLQALAQLETTISRLETNLPTRQRNLRHLDLDLDRKHSGYRYMIDYARQIIRKTQDYLDKAKYPEKFHSYGKAYFYHQQLLNLFNHQRYGMLAYYNRFVGFANQTILKQVEKPAWFKVITDLKQVSEPMFVSNIAPVAKRKEVPVIESISLPDQGTPLHSMAVSTEVASPRLRPAALSVDKAPKAEARKTQMIAEASIDQSLIAPRHRLTIPENVSLRGAAANHLIFLIDASASMNAPEKLSLMKRSLSVLTKNMRTKDKITIIAFSGKSRVVLEPTSALQYDKIVESINQLRSGGSSNLQKGLREAYELAEKHFIQNGNNRLIVATDGSVKLTSGMSRLVRKKAWEDIVLSVFHVTSTTNYQSRERLNRLAQLGSGSYYMINAENAIRSMVQEATAVKGR